jgi:hypothetical protein
MSKACVKGLCQRLASKACVSGAFDGLEEVDAVARFPLNGSREALVGVVAC